MSLPVWWSGSNFNSFMWGGLHNYCFCGIKQLEESSVEFFENKYLGGRDETIKFSETFYSFFDAGSAGSCSWYSDCNCSGISGGAGN